MVIRKMTALDIPVVYEISCECFTHGWSKASIEKEVDNTVASYFVAEIEDEIIGYGGIWRMADEGEVINIAVKRANRKNNVGTKILEKLIQEAKIHQLYALFLEVRESNLAAQALYHKLGFVEVGRRKNYYQDPKEDAVNMVCYLEEKDF